MAAQLLTADLRIQCFNLDEGILTVHDGKGQKDRTVPLPKVLLPRIRKQFDRVDALRREDLVQGTAGVFLPRNLEKKYPNAGREFIWQWFFPAKQLSVVKATGEQKRYAVRSIWREHTLLHRTCHPAPLLPSTIAISSGVRL